MGAPFSFIGEADAYVDILSDTGVRTGLELKGNCSEFTPKPDAERKEQTSNGRGKTGQVIASVTLPKPMTCTVKFNQLDQALFAAAFFGTNSILTQAAGAAAERDVTTIEDKWVEIGGVMLASAVVTDPTGLTTYVLGTDYELNTRLSMIKALATGSIPSGEICKVTPTYAAVNGVEMKAMTKSNVRIRVKLDGQNFADGRDFITDVYMMRLNPTSNFSFIGTEFAEVTFDGVLETPTGFDEPMKHTWLS
ncbi:MAG: hypothetical protein FP810_18445 [Desulfocapsa sp.]|nr:hypothetical protein [Desulfocapsa sp.]MBU4108133.1 hypothetical protein [Pseudomonadota bacterium]MCG2744271.1 hypothetical protein [Desulfobacteraceae bacterium]